jgi:hypothetical protein
MASNSTSVSSSNCSSAGSQFSPKRSQRLLQALGERAADRHHLTDGLHLGAEHAGRAGQFLERPPRDLRDDVVDHRFERRRCGPGDVVGDLVERVADGEAGGDLGDREPGGLGGQRRRT